MRSLLFVPGDSERKLSKSLESEADALILDLEDSVAHDAKAAARRSISDFLRAARRREPRPRLYVRINALASGLSDQDLDAVMPAAPDGIMLPKSRDGADVMLLDAKLSVREAAAGATDGTTKIVAIVTETAGALFGLATYREAGARLEAMSWGAEDLSAELGAETSRARDGSYTDPYRLARALCLFAAVNADAMPIDTVYTGIRDLDGLRIEAEAACRDGFLGKLAIHPAQVPVINGVFTPTKDAIARARQVVAAFAAAGGAGVIAFEGAMLDEPHRRRAERLLARAKSLGLA
jgi:citrate lyase subunit beta/citryl-CoA lyase